MAKKLRWGIVTVLVIAGALYAQEEAQIPETPDIEQVAEQPEQEATEEAVATEAPAQEEQVAPAEPAVEEQQAPEVTPEATPAPEEAPVQEEPAVEAAPETPAEEPAAEAVAEGPVAEEPAEQVAPPAEQPQLGEDEVMGIDTVDIQEPQGNWLYKRVWWERAEAKFEKIREVVNKVLEIRTDFFAKRAQLDKDILDPFYLKIGMSQGELQEVIKELVAKVEKMIATPQTDEMLEKAEEDKKSLSGLQQKVDKVVTQDHEVDNAINLLVQQISKMRSIEQQAWQDFKNIARVLDDKKARELFYKVDAAWRNVKDLQQYIEQTFANRFEQVVSNVEKDVKTVEQEMNAIKESGINLQQRLLSTEAEEMEDDQEAEEEPEGFFSYWIITPIKAVFATIWDVITWPYHKLFGTEAASEDDEEGVMAEEVEITTEEPSQDEEEEQEEPQQMMEPEAFKPAELEDATQELEAE